MKRIGPPKKWTRHRIYDVLFQSSVKALHVSYFLLTGLFIVQVVGYVKVDKPKFLEEHKRKEAERMAELQEKAEKERLGFQTT